MEEHLSEQELSDLRNELYATTKADLIEEFIKNYAQLKISQQKNKTYETAFAGIKEDLICLHNFAIPFHRGCTHNLADMIQNTKYKVVTLIDSILGINPLEANEREWHELLKRSEVLCKH